MQQQQQQQQMRMQQQQMQHQPRGGPQAYAQQTNDPFLRKLQGAEQRDTRQQVVPNPMPTGKSTPPITQDNWAQRSKNIAKLAIQNEYAELAAKERLGLLPSAPPEPQQMMGRQQPPGPSMAQAMGNGQGFGRQQQMQMQQRAQTPQQRQQAILQQPLGAQPRGFSAPGQQQQQMANMTPQQRQQMQMQLQRQQQAGQAAQHVMRQQSFDPWDDRVPDQLRNGHTVMSAAQGAQARRGNASSIVFG